MANRILVVEDDTAISELICMNLEVTGYEVVPVLDGNEVEEHWRKRRILTWHCWISCCRAKTALNFSEL